MNCPKCKNPIEDSAALCQWCGAVVENSEMESQNQENGFEETIKEMLSETPYEFVVQYYKETTGKSLEESKYDVFKIDFFRTHEFADETAWQKYYEDYIEKNKSPVASCIIAIIIGIVIVGLIFLLISLIRMI